MTPLHTGDQLGHFRIEGVAARSGMASVFRGTDLRTGIPVAIKVPHPESLTTGRIPERCSRMRCGNFFGPPVAQGPHAKLKQGDLK